MTYRRTMCHHFLLLFLVLIVCVFLCISVCIYLFLPCLVSWGKHHECVYKLRPECCSGCRERQSERHIRRYAVKTSVMAQNTLLQKNGRILHKQFRVIPAGGRREVPLNRDFFVNFGKTVVKPEEILLSVFIPFTTKV